jgi:serine/threonine protein kinase
MSDSSWTTTVPDSRHPSGSRKVSLHDALAPGTRLGEFEILSVLGIGAFGIVYLADDHVLVRRVAIKEYMPAALAGRRDAMPVSLRSPEFAATFDRGLDSFLSEARLLASFDHPALVKVHRFWRGNGTAYMAMQHYPGATLKDVRLAMAAPPDERWLLALVEPLLDALALLHGQGVFHRDISPDNIMILPDGRPVLLDFGSARRVIGNGSQFLSAVLKPPFAPVEQYANEGEMRQGPWTDLYALGATLYFAITGRAPTPSVVRAVDDVLPVLSERGDAAFAALPARLLATIDWMLAMAPDDRPRDIDAVRRALRGELAPPPSLRAAVMHEEQRADDHDVDFSFEEENDTASAAGDDDGPPRATASPDVAPSDGQRLDREEIAQGGRRRDPRMAVVALALLGVVVFAGGAWTLNRSVPTSPALASLAAALRAPASAPVVQAAVRASEPPRIPVATSSVQPVMAVDPEPLRLDSSQAVQVPELTPGPPATRPSVQDRKQLRHGRSVERSWSPSRAPDAPLRGQVQTVAVRTKSTPSQAIGSCEALAGFSHVLCALRECKSPSSAQPKCVRGRQIEQARQRRMERE